MKKIFLSLLFVLLAANTVIAQGIYLPVASGTVAAASIAVTLTDGSANIDISSAAIPRNYKGNLIKIYDANNVMIQGYVYTDGTGTVQNIVSAKGGATRNWATSGAGFNDTTNCRYEIYKVLDAPVVASGSITDGNALIDATTANAFAAPVGVDLSAYQTGKYILALYDSSGYAAIGWISATAPSGEALGDELISDPTFDDSGDWSIDTGWVIAGGKVTATNAAYGTYTRQSISVTQYSLIKAVVVCDSYTSGSLGISIGSNYVTVAPEAATLTVYGTDRVSGGGVYNGLFAIATLTASFTDISFKQVTMPAATGALLLSTKGGSRGFLYKHASFNPNAAMTYKVLYVGD